MGLVGAVGRQSPASQAELTGNSAAWRPHICWPRPAVKSVSEAPIPLSAGNGNSMLITDSKWLGSPGSTPHRFVALSANHGPLFNNDWPAKSTAWTSLYGALTM